MHEYSINFEQNTSLQSVCSELIIISFLDQFTLKSDTSAKVVDEIFVDFS